jgi:fibronectin-binding autotransporter adhesin
MKSKTIHGPNGKGDGTTDRFSATLPLEVSAVLPVARISLGTAWRAWADGQRHAADLKECEICGPAIPRSRGAWTIAACCWLAFLASAPVVRAVDYGSSGSGDWATSTIWTPNGVPAAGDTVLIHNGHTVTTAAAAGADAITVDSGGTFIVGAATSTGWILNKGTLRIGAGTSTTARTLSIGGSFTNYGPIIMGSTSPKHTIAFTADGFWVGSGDLSSIKVAVKVNSGVTLDITGLTNSMKFRQSGTQDPTISGTLIAGTSVIDLNNGTTVTFTLAAGGTLVTANPNGISGTIINHVIPPVCDPGANYVFNGTSAQVTAGLSATVNDLTISNAAGVTLGTHTTVNGTLNLAKGVLTTSSSATPTNLNALITTVGSYVNGPLTMVYSSPYAQSFPIGKGGNARTITLNLTAADNPSYFTIEQFESAMGGTPPASTAQFGSRYWKVSQVGASALTYDLTLDGTGFSLSATAVILREGAPDASYSTTFSSPNYTAKGLTSVGNFTLGDYNPSAEQLKFTSAAQTLTAGVASATITVQLQNSSGTPKNATSDLPVNLSTTSGGGAFRDLGDTTTITNVTIPTGNSSATFKYRDTLAPATPTIRASAGGGRTPATQLETINPGPASRLAFTTPPVTALLNGTMASVAVQVQDPYGNPVAQSGTAITLTLGNGGSAVLMGTIHRNTDATGAATFNDLAVTGAPGTGMILTATGGGLPTAVSISFEILRRIVVKALNTNPMNLDASWQNPPPPGSSDVAQIDNTSVNANTAGRNADIGDHANWYGLRVIGWAPNTAYTITDTTGGRVVTLGAGGLVGTNLTFNLNIDCGFALGTSQTWTWGSGPGAGTLTVNGIIDNGGNTLPIGGAQPISLFGIISGVGGLVKNGTNTLTLGGTNTYSGPTTINAGTLRLGNNTIGRDGTIANSQWLTNNGALVFNRYDSASYGGAIVGSGSVTMSGQGMQTLSGANTYTGNTLITGGTLLTTKAAALPGYDTAGRVIVNGGSVGVQAGGSGWTTAQVDTLLASASVTNGALGIDTSNGGLTQWTAFTTANFRTLGLTKLGANTLTLDRANTYTGATAVRGGTLALGSNGSINNSPTLTVASGAMLDVSPVSGGYQVAAGQTLTGGGAVLGAVTVASGATLAPGGATIATLGPLTMTGTLVLKAGSTNQFVLSATNNLTDSVTGPPSVTYSGRLVVVNLDGPGTLTLGQSFPLFTSGTKNGNFESMNLPPLDGGLGWDWDPGTGTLSVGVAPANIATSVSRGTLTLTWPSIYAGWYCQSNSVSLINRNYWFDIPGSESVTTMSLPINASTANVFFRLRAP